MRRLVIPIALGVAIFVAALTAQDRRHTAPHQQAPARSLLSLNR